MNAAYRVAGILLTLAIAACVGLWVGHAIEPLMRLGA